ncbi:hypothetical protein JXA70_05055 [candidate division KSB1 bacterium]|nr:hypothetical protein [candidate division KSB1 bacterium]
MKLWNKTFTWDFGDTILSWRIRDGARFFWKILSWLLGAFVFGLGTSIFFLAIQMPHMSLPAARAVFFIVFILGIVSNWFRAIVFGYQYKITQRAIVHAHPFFGWEKLGVILGSEDKPFRQMNYYFDWQEIKEIREQEKGLVILKNDLEIEIPVHNVIKLVMNLNLNKPEPKAKGASKSEKLAYDKAVLRIVLQATREARRKALNSSSAN